ncbi:MAG: purine-nucleoside phosphorylase [Deltaproteobacteria bacterium]|nr:purine-nucleoside phosphorylase [Deltaproteobacteria bacterium]
METDAARELARIDRAVEFLSPHIRDVPKTGVVLGSGLGSYAERMSDIVTLPYSEIPGFPVSSVQGHAGRLVTGTKHGIRVIVMQGRVHMYEGYHLLDVVLPVRVLARLGIENLVVTNAAGGVNPSFIPGDLMLIKDHLNLTGANPLTGANLDDLGPRFPDMSNAYDPGLASLAWESAKSLGIDLKKGVYAWLPGPSYETPSEVKMLRLLGADATGMSTVPEVIAAIHAGLRVLGLSCITNKAAGLSDTSLNHEEVKETAARVEKNFVNLIDVIVGKI